MYPLLTISAPTLQMVRLPRDVRALIQTPIHTLAINTHAQAMRQHTLYSAWQGLLAVFVQLAASGTHQHTRGLNIRGAHTYALC